MLLTKVDLNSIIDSRIIDEIIEYCELNSLDYSKFINEKLKSSIIIEKYGSCPPFISFNNTEKCNKYVINETEKESLIEIENKPKVKHRKISSK